MSGDYLLSGSSSATNWIPLGRMTYPTVPQFLHLLNGDQQHISHREVVTTRLMKMLPDASAHDSRIDVREVWGDSVR